jgi:hypothetical protein
MTVTATFAPGEEEVMGFAALYPSYWLPFVARHHTDGTSRYRTFLWYSV